MKKVYIIIWCSLNVLACGPGSQDSAPKQTTASGAQLFKQHCVLCHGSDGKLGLNGAKDLSISALSLEERVSIITNGKNLMTPFGKILSPEEVHAVASFSLSLNQSKNK